MRTEFTASILALGHVTSRASYYNSISSVEQSIVQEAVALLLEILAGTRDNLTKEAVFNALGQMSMSGTLTGVYVEKSISKASGVI